MEIKRTQKEEQTSLISVKVGEKDLSLIHI